MNADEPAAGVIGIEPAARVSPASIRPVAGTATALMVAVAAAALTDLAWAFTPLAGMWAAREAAARGGQLPGAVVIAAHVGVPALIVVTHVAAWVLLGLWLGRADANVRVLDLGPRSSAAAVRAWLAPAPVVSAVARACLCRRPAALVWSWSLAWVAGVAAMLAGTALTWPSELRDILAQVLDGATVDVDRADQLLGYQIAGRLPGAVLLLAAAVLGMVAVDRVTAAQYDRFDELR